MFLIDGITSLFKEVGEWLKEILTSYSKWRLKKMESKIAWFQNVATELENTRARTKHPKLKKGFIRAMKFIVRLNSFMPIIYGYWLGRYLGLALLKVLAIIIVSDILVSILLVPLAIRLYKVISYLVEYTNF